MANADLGTKRQCANCGAKFYDLNRDPIICPRCGTVFEQPVTRARPAARAAEPEDEEVEADAEIISLEEADEEAAGGAEDVEGDDEIEAGEEAEDAFLEEDEEEGGDDVSDIVGDVDDEER